MDVANAGHVHVYTSISHQAVPESATFHTSGTQIQGTVIQSQESVSYNF